MVAGGLALGFALSRMLKASSTQRYQASPARRPTTPSSNGEGYGSPLPPAAPRVEPAAPGLQQRG